MGYEFIKVEKRDHITIVTINRPDVMNAIHPPASKEMSCAFDEFEEDPDAWVCIITGAGDRAFSAGNDLKYQAKHGEDAVRAGMKGVKGGFAGITFRFDCFKPIIAAVNGLALAGGFEIALACDIIIAAENAGFGLPEHRVGLVPGSGGVHRLAKQVPYHFAMTMILASRQITAQEAMQFGIVAEVVPQAQLMKTALKWADEILKGAPLSMRASKEALLKGLHMPLEEAMYAHYPGMDKALDSEDLVEGPRAFAEKRPPHWKGR